MTRSLCVPLLCALFSLPIHAGSVEFAQWIPWDFVSQELRKSEFILNEKESAMTIVAGELKPRLSQVELDLKGAFSSLNVGINDISLSGKGFLSLRIGSLHIDQMVVREFGGNVLQVHIKADCSGTSIEIPLFQLQTLFTLKEEKGWLPELSDLHLEIPEGSWKVSPFVCEGLSGIGQEIEIQLSNALKNPAHFSNLIRESIAPFLDQWVSQKWVNLRSSDGQWENLKLDPPEKNGFLIRGELPLQGSEDVLLPDEIPGDVKGEVPRFFLSREGFEALIQDHLRNLIPVIYDLRDNDGFKKLMKSKVMQFLVWSDLRRFHSSTPFVLKNDPSSLNLSLTKNGPDWKADVSGRGSLTTVIGGAPIDYLVYSMSVSVPVQMQLKDGQLRFSTGKAAAKLSWSFGYLYQLLYKPENRLPVNILTSALAGLTGGKSQMVSLPRFSAGKKEYVLSNLNIQDQLITMDWL